MDNYRPYETTDVTSYTYPNLIYLSLWKGPRYETYRQTILDDLLECFFFQTSIWTLHSAIFTSRDSLIDVPDRHALLYWHINPQANKTQYINGVSSCIVLLGSVGEITET